MLIGLYLRVTGNQTNHSPKQKANAIHTIQYVGMDVTVATLIWAQWAAEDYSTVRVVDSSCMLCARCFTLKRKLKPVGGKKNLFGTTIFKAPFTTKHIFLHLFDEQILGRVQYKVNRNVRRLHKHGGLVKVEQADILEWVGNLLSSGLIGFHGKPPKETIAASLEKYLTFSPHQRFQNWFSLFCAEDKGNVTTLFKEINQLQERLGFNFRTSHKSAQVLCIEKYKIDFRDSQHPNDLRVALLVEKETGYICNFYIYSITEVLRQTQCIPFLYIIRKLLGSFCRRNCTVQIDRSAHINEAIIEEFDKLGIKLQLVSKLGGKYGSAGNGESHARILRDYAKLSYLEGYSIFPVHGRDYETITFLVVFWLLVHFSCINAFIIYLLKTVEDLSLQKFVKRLLREVFGKDTHSSITQSEETTSEEDTDTDDTECENGPTGTHRRISQPNDLPMQRNEPGVTGLRNLHNTCYMNAVLQCLSCTTPLVEYFFSWQFETFVAREKKELVNAFAKLMADMWFGKFQYLLPDDFLSAICNVHPPFGKHSQQDAQELLIYTLNALHEDLTNNAKKSSSDTNGNRSMRVHTSESLITHIIQGVLRQNTACLACGHTSHKDDVFTVLSLPIASQEESSVQECLENFFEQVTLTTTNKIFCPVCKIKQDASVKTQIWKLPKILILHLKRFEYKGQLKRKLKMNVDFPLKNLDLKPFLSTLCVKPQKYRLYAVVNHYGELDYGHYTAFCKHPGTKEWNAFDDISSFQIAESAVKTSSAYILFYTNQAFSFPKKTNSSIPY